MRSEKFIPCDKEGLREVVLVAIELMVNIVVSTIIAEDHMKEVARKPKSTMIIDSLDCSKREEEYCSMRGHARDEERESTTNGVED